MLWWLCSALTHINLLFFWKTTIFQRTRVLYKNILKSCIIFGSFKLQAWNTSLYFMLILMIKYVMRCAIWYHLYNLKNVKNTHGGVLILVKLQASADNFTKINTPPWVFFTFVQMHVCMFVQIVQMVPNRATHHILLILQTETSTLGALHAIPQIFYYWLQD